MAFGVAREAFIHEKLREISDLVRREESSRALARLNRIDIDPLSEEERLRVLLLRSWAHLQAQQWEELEAVLDEAATQFPDSLDRRLLQSHLDAHAGRHRTAVRQAAAVARISSREEHTARAYMVIGLALFRTRHFTWAIRFSEKAAAFYDWSGDRLLSAWVHTNIALCHKALAQGDVALHYLRKASALLPHQGYAHIRLRLRINEGVVLMLLGDLAAARNAFVQAQQMQSFADIESPGSPLHASLLCNNIGHTYRMQGDLDRALEYYEDALQTAENARLLRQRCISLFWMGEVLTLKRDWQAAGDIFDRAERLAKRLKHGGLLQEILRRRADWWAAQGKRRQAGACLDRAEELAKTLMQPRDRALLQRTRLLLRQEAPASSEVQDLLEAFMAVGDRYELSRTVLLLFETFDLDPVASGLEAVTGQARYDMSAMGLRAWQERLERALQGTLPSPTTTKDFQSNKQAFERSEIEKALVQANGVATRAAGLLGMGRNTLAAKIRAHGIDRRAIAAKARLSRS